MFLGNGYFLRATGFSSSVSRVLRRSGNAGHHDGDHVLVHTKDVDQVRMLEEDVVVHQGPEMVQNGVRVVQIT